MRRAVLIILLTFMWAAPAGAREPDCDPLLNVQNGTALHGGPVLAAGCGDLYIRNLQGTGPVGGPHNLDLGGGSTQDPGDVVVNWDVGDAFKVFDGWHGKLLVADDHGTDVYRRLRVCTDVCREVATVDPPPPPKALISTRLARRVSRLERRVKRLRLTVRRLARNL